MDDEIRSWSTTPESQFFERKSAFDRSMGRLKRRNARDIAWDVVETLSAMANADGGDLVIGIEDDGTVSGAPHPDDKTALIRRAAAEHQYVSPPIRFQVRDVQTTTGELLLHFAVDWSPEVHQLADGRYLLRVGAANVPFAAPAIAALKATKGQGLIERSFPPGATLDDIDLELVVSLAGRVGETGPPERTLHRFRLLEDRQERSVPNLAGLLLFGKDPQRWHPRCGVDFVRWEGTERRFGAELNVAKRVRIERPLAALVERTFEAIRPYIRERHQLQTLFFSERLEYPTFVWQEALVNAVAHRDYGIHGAQVEIWMFDDRLEVRSPGLPPHPVTVEALARRERLHLSRNPLIMRVFAELGFVRELGEGIPRMFAVMEREGFYPPRFENIGQTYFGVTLRNQPVYDQATLTWLKQFDTLDLSGDQKRLLAYAHAHGDRFTSREYQKLVGLDLYGASNSIKLLMRKGTIQSTGKSSRVYQITPTRPQDASPPEDLQRVLDTLGSHERMSNKAVRDALGVSRPTATRYLQLWVDTGWLMAEGSHRGRRYGAGRRMRGD
ncbi:MAG: putative DNA binding domain-containing protein [Chloroflexi bacterium]|nr:putative DNA binding domain-containing protein [Chloroflexota bacterium]